MLAYKFLLIGSRIILLHLPGRIMEYLIAVTVFAVLFSVLVCWALGLT